VSDVYKKLEQELQDPALPAAAVPDLVLYMLQLQSQGLDVAKGQDPLALFLAARQKQFSTAIEQAVLEYQQGMGSLRGQMAAATAKDGKQQVRLGGRVMCLAAAEMCKTSWVSINIGPGP
jgi:hypothetical protein